MTALSTIVRPRNPSFSAHSTTTGPTAGPAPLARPSLLPEAPTESWNRVLASSGSLALLTSRSYYRGHFNSRDNKTWLPAINHFYKTCLLCLRVLESRILSEQGVLEKESSTQQKICIPPSSGELPSSSVQDQANFIILSSGQGEKKEKSNLL